MNEKNYKALLKSLGISDSVITELDKDDFDVKAAVAAFNESQKAHYTDIIKNEVRPEIEAEVTKEVEGKLYSTLRNDIKKNFGVPADKLKELFPHDMLKVAKTHIEEVYSKGQNAEELRKMQEDLMKARNDVTEWENKLPKEVERIQKEFKQKAVYKLADIDLQKKFNSIPAEKLLGKVHAPGYFVAMKTDILSKYDLDLDDNENPILLEKGTSKRVMAKNSENKDYFPTLDDLALTSLDTLGFLSKSNGGEGSGNSGKNGNGNGGTQEKSAYMQSLEQRARAAQAA